MPSSTILPAALAVPAVALSLISTLRVLKYIGSTHKPGFYIVVDTTGVFIIILGLVGYTARILAGSGNLIGLKVSGKDDEVDDTLTEEIVDTPSDHVNNGFIWSAEDTEDTLEVVRGGDDDYEDLPDSDQEQRGRKVKTMSAQKKRWRRIALFNKKDETMRVSCMGTISFNRGSGHMASRRSSNTVQQLGME